MKFDYEKIFKMHDARDYIIRNKIYDTNALCAACYLDDMSMFNFLIDLCVPISGCVIKNVQSVKMLRRIYELLEDTDKVLINKYIEYFNNNILKHVANCKLKNINFSLFDSNYLCKDAIKKNDIERLKIFLRHCDNINYENLFVFTIEMKRGSLLEVLVRTGRIKFEFIKRENRIACNELIGMIKSRLLIESREAMIEIREYIEKNRDKTLNQYFDFFKNNGLHYRYANPFSICDDEMKAATYLLIKNIIDSLP